MICCVLALAGSAATVDWMLDARAPAGIEALVPRVPSRPAAAPRVAVAPGFGGLANPGFSLGYTPGPLAGSAPLGAAFVAFARPPSSLLAQAEPPAAAPEAAVAPAAAAAGPIEAAAPVPPVRPDTAMPPPPLPQLVEAGPVPLPSPRPPELRMAASEPMRAHPRPMRSRGRTAVAAAPAPDNRSFFEKLFGGMAQPATAPALAYAAPEDGVSSLARTIASAPMVSSGGTAVYDIAAHTVYLPDGSRLEAHSGLGDKLDDPSQVHVRMRGPTPPHVYDLTMREALFHGVRALRLTPLGGEGRVFGRNGLLAHTYMLGPNGDSNGCVSFKNYQAFLQAYLSGQVRRLQVVPGRNG